MHNTETKSSGLVATAVLPELANSDFAASAVATAVPDFEAQACKQPAIIIRSHDPEAGKGIGVAMFILLLGAFVLNFVFPFGSFVCIIATIVLSSILSCGCCCASDYNLRANSKTFATSTLVSLCVMLLFQIIYTMSVVGNFSSEATDSGTINRTSGVLGVWAISVVLNISAIIFSALFTWGRGCAASRSSTVIAQ